MRLSERTGLFFYRLWKQCVARTTPVGTTTSHRLRAARNVLLATLFLLCIWVPVIVLQVLATQRLTVDLFELDNTHQSISFSRTLMRAQNMISGAAADLEEATISKAGDIALKEYGQDLLGRLFQLNTLNFVGHTALHGETLFLSSRNSTLILGTLPDGSKLDIRNLPGSTSNDGSAIPHTLGPFVTNAGGNSLLLTATFRRPGLTPPYGLVAVEFDIDLLLKENTKLQRHPVRQEICRDDGTHLWGTHSLQPEFPVTASFGVPGQIWRLLTVPRNGWFSLFPKDIFFFSGLGCVMLAGSGISIWRLTIKHCRLAQQLENQSAILEQANQQMQQDLEKIVLTQKQLAVSELRTRMIYEQMPVGVGLLDAASGRFLAVNPQGCRILAATESDLRLLCLQDLIVLSEAEQIPDNNRPQRIEAGECAIRSGSHTIRQVQLALAPIIAQENESERQLVVFQDITDRWQAQRENREHQERIRVLTDMLPGPLLYIDADGRCQFTNAAMLELLEKISGSPGSSPLGRRTDEFVPEVIYHFLKPRIAEALLGQTSQFETTPEIEQLGYGAWMFFHRPLRLQGQVVGFFAFLLDITQQRSDERQRRDFDSRIAEAQRMETVGTLAGGVAHEFNNMLQVVLGLADVLLVHAENDAFVVENLNHIRQATRRASDLTRQLLAFARFQPGSPGEVNFAEVIPASLKLLRHAAGDEMKLRWTCVEPIDSVLIDPSRLDLILANLILNARHAMDDRGVIEIDARNLPAIASAEPGLSVAGQATVLLSVRDTGCGMNPEVQARMFDPFFSTRAVGKGTGLGLSTVYGLVLQAGGRIDVQSAPGKGTCIHLLFPSISAPPNNSQVHTPAVDTY